MGDELGFHEGHRSSLLSVRAGWESSAGWEAPAVPSKGPRTEEHWAAGTSVHGNSQEQLDLATFPTAALAS